LVVFIYKYYRLELSRITFGIDRQNSETTKKCWSNFRRFESTQKVL